MDKLASPDIPAYWCYFAVLAVGMMVAMANVNRLLADQPGHWAFLNTWLVFAAYSALPVVLFWFLDYTTAVKDTSLFAALVVAVGYQQIFAGGVQGITMSGQTARLWQPFESWVKAIAARIAISSKRSKDKFEEGVNSYIVSDPPLIERLQAVALQYSTDAAKLQEDLDAILRTTKPPTMSDEDFANMQNRRRARLLVDNLRAAMPLSFGDLLRNRKLVKKWDYWRWFRQLKSMTIAWVVLISLLLVGAMVWNWFFAGPTQLRYHQWRFSKASASDFDRFRAREHLGSCLQQASRAEPKLSNQEVSAILSPLMTQLRYKGVSSQLAEDIERILVDSHTAAVDQFAIPQLIEALKNENSDVRLHIRETLVALHDADFSQTTLPDAIANWVPKKDESVGAIASQVAGWKNWWNGGVPRSSPAPSAQPSPSPPP